MNLYTGAKVFFDRKPDTIDGLFSIRNRDGSYVVEKLHARSGQRGYTRTNWTTGKSPTPYGLHYLSLHSNNRGQKAGAKGIGECFPMSNREELIQKGIIISDNGRYRRTEVCLHEENSYPGSAGCTVIVNRWPDVLAYLTGLREQGYDAILFEVL